MSEAFNWIPEVKASRGKKPENMDENKLKALKALKDQREVLNEKIIELGGKKVSKRTLKRDAAMSHLLKLSEMNKELKRVGWMNSKESALKQFELNPKKYDDWKVRADRDISGDGINDVVILNKHDEIIGVNGNTITKSKYPERQLYYSTYAHPADRRRQIDEDGNVTNLDRNGNPTYTSFGAFKKKEYNKINVVDGVANYTNEQASRLKKFTPFKTFTNVIMDTYWNHLKTQGVINEIPKHLRMRLYGLVKKYVWEAIKGHVITTKLNMNIPDNKDSLKLLENSNSFKEALNEELRDILRTKPVDMFNNFKDLYAKALGILRNGKYKKLKPSELKDQLRIVYDHLINEYGLNEDDYPFNDSYNDFLAVGYDNVNQDVYYEWLSSFINENKPDEE